MKRRRIFPSLRLKLGIIAVILIAIPMLAISMTYTKTVKEIISKKYTETAIQSVYEAGEQIDFILRDVEEFSTVIISDTELLEKAEKPDKYNVDEFNTLLRSFILSRDDIEVIDIVLPKGKYSIGANMIDSKMSVQEELQESSGQPVWLDTESHVIEILSGKFHKNYFALGRKIINYNTLEDLGYLVINLEEVMLEQAYKSLLDNQFEDIYICDDTGTIISHTDKKKIGSTIKFKPYAESILNTDKQKGHFEFTEGVDKVAIYSMIQSTGWKIIKTIPTNYLYKEINIIQRDFLIGGVIYGVAIIIFMIFFSVRYTDPMMKMMGVIKKVEQGDLTARTEISTNDEVGQLGKSLNKMIAEMGNLIDKLIKEEQEKKEVELEALHAQINPHFLYNTLNTIKWMAKIQGNNSVSRAIVALIKLLRVSTNLGTDKITLKEELEYVNNYVVIQKLKYNEGINIKLDIEESCMDRMMPKLILQPIVENAIIYGICEEHMDINIQIAAYKKDNELLIEIIDDGPGIQTEIVEEILRSKSDKNRFSKVGLNNINQRIKLYYGNEYGLSIESKLGVGTKVIVKIPIS
jgi:two-component system sensor histidine kinase YesM